MRTHLSLIFGTALLMSLLTACNSNESHARSTTANPNATQAGQATPADGVRRMSIAEARAEV